MGGVNIKGGSISGIVLDLPTRHTIEYANILIMTEQDSSMVIGGITDAKGNFNLKGLNPGNYYVEVKFIGYEIKRIKTTLTSENLKVDLGEILIQPSSILLENVVIEGDRSPVTYQIDKKVINPNQMLNAVSGNAADVLANVPSVQVDIEGNVSVRGSQSFTVLIDGRPSVLNPQDALQQIQANSIDKIELITNPSAKYDPEGTAGIINVILKKNTNKGLDGIVNADAGMHDSYGADFLINYQNDNIKTNISLDYSRKFYPGDLAQNNIHYLENNISSTNSACGVTRGRIGYEGRGGIEFIFSESNALSFGVRVGRRESQRMSSQNFTQFSEQDPSEYNYLGKSDRSRAGPYYALNSNYSHNFRSDGHQLLGELFYSYRNSDEITTTSEFVGAAQISGKKTTEFGPSIDFRGKLDYTLPFSEDSKFEAGYQGEIDLDEETNELYEYGIASDDYMFQPAFSNLNKYNRSEHAIYSLYSAKLWELQFQTGLRGEYTYRTIEVPTQNEYFNLDRFDYFPSFHTSYKFAESSTLMASYSRKIDRPGGWALEPFDTWIDANNVRRGNPNLQPEFIDSYETGIQTQLGITSFSTEIYYRIHITKSNVFKLHWTKT
jgi:outer membrane receptor protein involved in Fe transport